MSKNSKKIKVDSPEYHKKSKITFVIVLIACFAIGGLGGYFGAKATDLFKGDLTSLGKLLSEKLPYFQAYVMPWIILVFTIICTILGAVWITKAKKLIATWDGEDDAHIGIADAYLTNAGGVSNILMISIQILFGFSTYQLMTLFDKTGKTHMTILTIIIYFSGMFIALLQQSATVKLVKQYAPEKQGSIYDMKFQKVWFESCDEAERQMVGDAAYQTFRFMNNACSTMLFIAVIVGMFIPIGLLCAFFVGVLWLMMTCYYTHICKKLEQGK